MKKKKSLGCILLTLLFIGACRMNSLELVAAPASAVGPSPWRLVSVYSMPDRQGRFTSGFAFTRDYRLWTRGSSDAAHPSQLMYSEDFGNSWTSVDLPISRGLGSDGTIQFVDSKNGWAMDTENLLKTVDSGMSWTSVRLPRESKILNLNKISFRDADTGFVAGSSSHLVDRGLGQSLYGVEILCTRDGGNKWSICYKSATGDAADSIFSAGISTGVLIDNRTLVTTDDDGRTWKEKRLEFPATDIEAAGDAIWAAGEDGLIRYSRDLGDTWENSFSRPKTAGTDLRWSSISFSSGHAVAVGGAGTVAYSFDQGDSWTLHPEIKLKTNLWTVRVQKPYVAILDAKQLYVWRFDVDKGP